MTVSGNDRPSCVQCQDALDEVKEIMLSKARNADHTKARLIQAAKQLFSTKSYTEATIRDITALAGVNLTLARRYFGSKLELYRAVLDASLQNNLLIGHDRELFGKALVESFFEPPPGHVHSLPILLSGAADPEARMVAQRLLNQRIIEPLINWLDEEGADEKVAQIMMITSSFFLYRDKLPLEALQGEISDRMRRWLEDTLQQVVERR